MFHRLPAGLIQALLDSSNSNEGGSSGGREMHNLSRHEFELLQLFGAAAALMDEPWAEGEEGSSAATTQQEKNTSEASGEGASSSSSQKNSNCPNNTDDVENDNDNVDDDIKVKTKRSKRASNLEEDDEEENDEGMSPKGASRREEEEVGAENLKENDDKAARAVLKAVVKTEIVETEGENINSSQNNSPHLPKRSKSRNNSESTNQTGEESTEERKMGNVEQSRKRRELGRSRGSNVEDSSELEQLSETDEVDDRRISSRREQDCGGGGGGSSSRSRTPDRPGSDFGGSPSPFSASQHHQQQQFLQAGIPYLHLLPPHIRNDAARLFLMPQMLPPELAAAVAATTTTSSNQSPSPGSSSGGGTGGNVNANASQTVIPSSSSGKSEKNSQSPAVGENSRSGAMYICEPCNIKFSSARTLEAHQTYYCSFRKDSGRDGVRLEIEDVKTDIHLSSTPGNSSKKRDRDPCDEQQLHHELSLDESMESMDSFSGTNLSHNKSQKTGKLYSCIYCSYSADKKVSLNRHMRMHSGLSISSVAAATQQMPNSSKDELSCSAAAAVAAALGAATSATAIPSSSSSARPVTPGKSPSSCSSSSKNVQLPENVSALDRYCQDCDIQFSSIKTFRVHKQYYCSTRHVLKAQQTAVAAALAAAAGANPTAALGKPPVELGPGVTVTPVGKQSSASIASACSPIPEGSPVSTPVHMSSSSQPFIVLPTNPIIIVPYCFIQGASFLPGNVLPSENAIVVLPNGAVQSLPRGAGQSGTGMPIPIPSPSPQSLMMGFNHGMMHSPFPTSSATPGPSGITSPNNLSFPDAKEMMKMMNSNNNSGSKESLILRDDMDDRMMLSPSKIQKGNNNSSRNSGRSSSRSSEDAMSHHHDYRRGSVGNNNPDGCDDPNMPAIDLTFRGIQPKKEPISNGGGGGGEEEKENHEGGDLCSITGSTRNSRNVSRDSMIGVLEENSRSRSVTPGTSGHHHNQAVAAMGSSSSHHHNTESLSPLEKMSVGSGGKRTSRPSSASVSSSCSTPPALCEPKLNGMMNHILSSGVKDPHEANKMMMMMLNAGAAAAAVAAFEGNSMPGKSVKSGKGISITPVDYRGGSGSSSTGGVNGGKISPLSTQLPGGAILTSATSNQSLAELLMTNPPELNESLAKLNPQLLMNAQRAAVAAAAAATSGSSPVGFNFNLNPSAFMQALNPDIAMRLLDPAYLTSLQQSLQQQQQTSSTSQQQQQSVKRGVSKCIECDIVFYKYENYLVHKEHYCAARTNNNSTPQQSSSASSNNNMGYPPSKTPTPTGGSINSKSRGRSSIGNKDNATATATSCRMSSCSSPSKSEVDDEELNLPPPMAMLSRKNSIHQNRKSPDEFQNNGRQPKTKSPHSQQTSPLNISPVSSPKSSSSVITANNHHGKGSSGNGNQLPCPTCGVKFSTVDNLQTHQAYYCNNKRVKGAGGTFVENNGENNEYCGSGESINCKISGGANNNNGDGIAMILGGLPSPSSSSSEKEIMLKSPAAASSATSTSVRNGFLRCGKCKLAIPEEQMSTHIRVCLGTVSPSFGNGRGVGGGASSGEGVGWKCPCCDVYSPTVSAAQKHLETHTGIRAFKCLLCGYRGNTLRGMRTHIRTHFDKRVFDLLEGDYMTCITANDVEPATTSTTASSSHQHSDHRTVTSSSSPPMSSSRSHETSNKSNISNNKHHHRYSPESCKNVNQFSGTPSPVVGSEMDGSDIKLFHSPSEMLMMSMMTENDSSGRGSPKTSSENNNQPVHHCNLCSYSSPYKASILKHMKIVHKVQIPLDLTAAIEHETAAAVIEDVNGGASQQSRESSRNSTPKSSSASSALDYALAQGFPITNNISPVSAGKSLQDASSSSEIQASVTSSISTRSTRRGGATAVASNGTGGIGMLRVPKEEICYDGSNNISTAVAERKCSSHSSAEADDIGAPLTVKEKHHNNHNAVPPPTGSSPLPSGSLKEASSAGNYCKSCDISFQYVSSFQAHKEFYCSSLIPSDTETSERAETPVQ